MKLTIKKSKMIQGITSMVVIMIFILSIMISYNVNNLANSNQFKLVIAIFAFVFLYLMKKNKSKNIFYKKDIIFKILFLIYVLSILFCFVICNEYQLIVLPIMLVCIYSISQKVLTNFSKMQYKYIVMLFLIAYLVTFLIFPLNSVNSKGMILALTGILIMNLMCLNNKTSIRFFLIVTISLYSLLLITYSRTSILSFTIVCILSYYYIFIKKLNVRNLLLLMFLFLFSIFIVFYLGDFIQDYITRVFFHKWNTNDVTSGRSDIWTNIIENAKLLGHFKSINNIDAHNSYIQIMGCFGVIPFILYIILNIMIFIRIFKVKNKIIYLNFFMGWFCMSLFENLEPITSRMLPFTLFYFIHMKMLFEENFSKRRSEDMK